MRTNLHGETPYLPFTVYTVGMEQQPPICRLEGFSAHQLLITESGRGRVRLIGQHKWDLLTENTAMYIPAGVPNEYMPEDDGNWLVGFVSFHGSPAARASWGLGDAPTISTVRTSARLFSLLRQIWEQSGSDREPWASSELLFSLLTEWRKQSAVAGSLPQHLDPLSPAEIGTVSRSTGRESTVLQAAKFLQDHMHREIRIPELAERVGYSQKQLTRLFLHAFRMTPLQYLRHVRLKAAQNLLETNAGMPIGQIAARVGMEHTYFARTFHKTFGTMPSEYRTLKRAEAGKRS